MTTTSVTSASGAIVSSGNTLVVVSGGNATSTTVFAGGTLVVQAGGVETGAIISAGGSETISGTASGDQIYGSVTVPTGVSPTLTSETVYNGGVLTLSQGFTVNNIDIKSGGTLNAQGSGVLTNITMEGGGATLDALGGRLHTAGSLTLTNGGNIIEFTSPVLRLTMDPFASVIAGFSPTDEIDFKTVTYNPSSESLTSTISGGDTVVSFVSGGATVETFTFNSSIYYGNLSLINDGSGGTEIVTSVACYCRGTMILTNHGEVPVETLAIGDHVITASGAARPIKWIGTRSYGGRFIIGQKDILPVCVKKGAIADGVPHRDLWISPRHAMYLDGVLIEVKDLVNGVSVVQSEHADHVDYYHIELDSHDVIIAEGALSETFIDDDNRGMFRNAQDYAELYPQATASDTRYYAPRVEHGYDLEAARRSIALRAASGEQKSDVGELDGYIDFIGADRIEGWARNVNHPQTPVCLDVLAGGKLIGRTLAHLHRSDLEASGLGSSAFVFNLPAGFDIEPNAIEVRRSLDGRGLTLSHAGQLSANRLAAA